jgi:hypothetical protein
MRGTGPKEQDGRTNCSCLHLQFGHQWLLLPPWQRIAPVRALLVVVKAVRGFGGASHSESTPKACATQGTTRAKTQTLNLQTGSHFGAEPQRKQQITTRMNTSKHVARRAGTAGSVPAPALTTTSAQPTTTDMAIPPTSVPPLDQLWIIFSAGDKPQVIIPDAAEPDDQSPLSAKGSKRLAKLRGQLQNQWPAVEGFCRTLQQIKAEKLFRENHSAFFRFAITWGLEAIRLTEAINSTSNSIDRNQP